MRRPTHFNFGTQTGRRPASLTSAMTSIHGQKVKVAKSRDASDRCRPISREGNVLETPKLVGMLSTPLAMRTSFKVKGKGQGHQVDIMLIPEVCHIFERRGLRSSNLEYRWSTKTRIAVTVMDHHQQGQRLRSRCHMVRLTGVDR